MCAVPGTRQRLWSILHGKLLSTVCIAAHQAHWSGGLAPSLQLGLGPAIPAGDLPGLPRIVPILARRARRASAARQRRQATQCHAGLGRRCAQLRGAVHARDRTTPERTSSGVRALTRGTGTGPGDPGHLAASSASELQPALAAPRAWPPGQRCHYALLQRSPDGQDGASAHVDASQGGGHPVHRKPEEPVCWHLP